MFKVGYAQEIITPPTGVGLAGYFNKRPNEGMYDDLYVKVIMIEAKGKLCGFVSFDLGSVPAEIYTDLEAFLNVLRKCQAFIPPAGTGHLCLPNGAMPHVSC